MKKNIFKNRSGSSLLVAILIMGILMTITLGLSDLVVSEIRNNADVVAAGKAYFAAEAGIERGLFELNTNLPGYQTAGHVAADDAGWIDRAAAQKDQLHYRYRLKNQGDRYPYFDADEPIFTDPNTPVNKDFLYQENSVKTYNILPLNQTVTIPLYTVDANGKEVSIKDFSVQYFVNFNRPDIAGNDPKFLSNNYFEKLDVLRWRFYGNSIEGEVIGKTESISDFFPAMNGTDNLKPACFGTKPTDFGACTQTQTYFAKFGQQMPGSATVARECYFDDAGAQTAGAYKVRDLASGGCSIETFIGSHSRNYLTLTNIVNPDVINLPLQEDRQQKANIYYRIVLGKDVDGNSAQIPREFARISADGYANNDTIRQSIDVKFAPGSYLPVFNFSLYNTKSENKILSLPFNSGIFGPGL